MSSSTKKILEIIHLPLNIDESREVKYSEIKMVPIQRVCFRGCYLPPEEAFNEGFKSREMISESLYEKIEKINDEHLKAKPFLPKAFLAAMGAIKNQIQEETSTRLEQSFSKLSEPSYADWLEMILDQVDRGKLLVVSDDRVKDIKKAIYAPFESQQFICLSKRFKPAVLFPISPDLDKVPVKSTTYVYATYVEEGYDVHMQGIVSSLLNAKSDKESLREALKKANPLLDDEEIEKHMRNISGIQGVMNISLDEAKLMYVEEITAEQIPPEHVIAAIPAQRTMYLGEDGMVYGTYVLIDPIEVNELCCLDKKLIDQTVSVLKQEMKLNSEAHPLSAPEEGYHEGFVPPKID